MKRVMSFLVVLVMVMSLVACGASSSTNDVTDVRSLVTSTAAIEHMKMTGTIGGEKMASSQATITSMKEVSSDEYLVSGQMHMSDKYGSVTWTNYYDCTVKRINGSWKIVGGFKYTSNTWRRK